MFRKKLNTPRNIKPVKLMGYPPLMETIFNLLKKCEIKYFAIFGGAIRDADYAERHHEPLSIKDYDVRIWLSPNEIEKAKNGFFEKLRMHSGGSIAETSSPGTGKIRYCLSYMNAELDISIREIPEKFINEKKISIEAVAIDRANDSDIGLSSVAIDPSGQAWATPEYVEDQDNETLTVYQNENEIRVREYLERMRRKFPGHLVIHAGSQAAENTKSTFKV
jgi:hypothetical protein